VHSEVRAVEEKAAKLVEEAIRKTADEALARKKLEDGTV
jgi:hypothetical protein